MVLFIDNYCHVSVNLGIIWHFLGSASASQVRSSLSICVLFSAVCLSTFLLVLSGDGPEIPKLYPLTLGFIGVSRCGSCGLLVDFLQGFMSFHSFGDDHCLGTVELTVQMPDVE